MAGRGGPWRGGAGRGGAGRAGLGGPGWAGWPAPGCRGALLRGLLVAGMPGWRAGGRFRDVAGLGRATGSMEHRAAPDRLDGASSRLAGRCGCGPAAAGWGASARRGICVRWCPARGSTAQLGRPPANCVPQTHVSPLKGPGGSAWPYLLAAAATIPANGLDPRTTRRPGTVRTPRASWPSMAASSSSAAPRPTSSRHLSTLVSGG